MLFVAIYFYKTKESLVMFVSWFMCIQRIPAPEKMNFYLDWLKMTILRKWGNSWSSVEIYPLWKDTKPDFVSKLLVHLSHRQQSTSQASLVNILFLRSGVSLVHTHLVHTHFVHTHPPCAQSPCAQPPSAHPPCTHPPCTDPLLHTYPITVDKLLPNYFPLLNLGFQNCDMHSFLYSCIWKILDSSLHCNLTLSSMAVPTTKWL